MSDISNMNPEVRDQWIKDLRSGEFAKITGQLVNPEEGEKCRCALGVLLYRAEEAGVVKRINNVIGVFVEDEHGYTHRALENGRLDWASYSDTDLPTAARVWAGVPGNDLHLLGGTSVIDLNDTEGLTFQEIADLIELDAKLAEEVTA